MNAPALTPAQRRQKVRMRFRSFGALAQALSISECAVMNGLDTGRTTLPVFQRCMAGIGIPIRLVKRGDGLRGKPFCLSARAAETFAQRGAR